MKKNWTRLCLALLLPVICIATPHLLAQAANAGSVSGQVVTPFGGPAANAKVYVCPTTATGIPCSPLASLFSDNNLSQAISNPLTTDANGNYKAFLASGLYTIQVVLAGSSAAQASVYYASPGAAAGGAGGSVLPGNSNTPLGYYTSSSAVISPANGPATDSTGQSLITKLPKIDPRSAFVLASPSSCANAADPTGTLDSTCAIQAAITYQNTHPVTSANKPCLHLATGIYTVTSTIVTQGAACIEGDEHGATIIHYTANSGNLFTDLLGTRVLPYLGLTLRDITLQGNGSCTVGAAGCPTKNPLGSLLEVDADFELTLQNVNFYDTDGICLDLQQGAERSQISNVTFGHCRKAIQSGRDINETHFLGLTDEDPGIDSSGYCWNTNCVSGVYPVANQGPISSSTWASATFFIHDTIISDATVNCSGGACNQRLVSQSCTTGGSTPGWASSDGGLTTDGTCTWKNVSNRTLIAPDPHMSVTLNGVNVNINSFSLKATQYEGGVSNLQEANNLKNGYFEGFGTGINSAIIARRYIEHYPLTGNINSSALIIPISNMAWFWFYVDDPANAVVASSTTSNTFAIVPNDYLSTSSSPSSVQPGVNRNQYELVQVRAGARDGNVYVQTRCLSGSTVCTSWNAGDSFMFYANFTTPVGAPSFTANHFHSFQNPAAGYSYNCNDITAPCGEIINGYWADGTVLSLTSKFPLISGASAIVIDAGNSFFTSSNEDQGHIVGTIPGSTVISSGYTAASGALGSLPAVNATSFINGGFLGTNLSLGFVPWVVWTGGSATASYVVNTPRFNLATVNSNVSESYVDANMSTSIGGHPAAAEQIQNEKCTYSTPVPPSTQPLEAVCFDGGPLFTPLFYVEHWNGSAFVKQFTISPASGNASLTGSMSVAGSTTTNGLSTPAAAIGGVGVGNSSNLLTQSNNFTNSFWTNNVGVFPTVTGGQADPFGTSTAYQLVTASGGMSIIQTATALTPGQCYQAQIWAYATTTGHTLGIGGANTTGSPQPLTTSWPSQPYTALFTPDSSHPTWTMNLVTDASSFTLFVTAASVTTSSSSFCPAPNNSAPYNLTAPVPYFPTAGSAQLTNIPMISIGANLLSLPPIRAGSVTITSSTTQAVTFSPAMSVTPTSCSLTPTASAATTGTPFATSLATTGFTANVPNSGTLAMTYQCVVNNAN